MTAPGPAFTRPCPIPGHPGDDPSVGPPGDERRGESALSRFRAWHREAPAERLPLTASAVTWPAGWALHELHTPGTDIGIAAAVAAACAWAVWEGRQRRIRKAAADGRELPGRLTGTEAMLVAAAAGGWITAAVVWGPLAGPWCALSLTYVLAALGGTWWLRRHEAVLAARARRDEAAELVRRKAEWHGLAPKVGLGEFDLQKFTPTLLGEELLLTGSPNGDLVSQVVAHGRGICERLEHWWGLPYNSVDLAMTRWPGQVLVQVRRVDPSVNGPVKHPALDPESRFARYFPPVASVRDPVPWGFSPETGDVLTERLWDPALGGLTIGVYGTTGSGKTTKLNVLRERITAMDDAILIQVNGAKVGDELAWEPLAGATAAGSAQHDEASAARIMRLLEWLEWLVTERSATHVITGDSIFQPTPEDPALVILIDEIDEVAAIPGASRILQFLASKQRAEALTLVLSGQRATQQWTGGGGVRANLNMAFAGLMLRDSETRHVSGASYDIPDISEYSGGAPGYFQMWDPRSKKVIARGRAFDVGTIGEQQRKIIWHRDPAGRPKLPGPPLMLDDPEPESVTTDDSSRPYTLGEPGEGPIQGLRARLAAVRSGPARPAQPAAVRPAAPRAAARKVPGIPPGAEQAMITLGRGPEGTTARDLAQRLGVAKSTANAYLAAAAKAGVMVQESAGPAARWKVLPPARGGDAPGYVTIEDLAEAVRTGEVTTDDGTRETLLAAEREARKARLRLVPTGTDEGDAQ